MCLHPVIGEWHNDMIDAITPKSQLKCELKCDMY